MSAIGSISAGLPIGAASWISSTSATSRTTSRMPVQPEPTATVPNSSTGISFQDLQKQIVAAVKDAVAKLDPNASPSDMKSAIQGAVDGVLKKNGVDPAQMPHGRHHHGGAGAASSAVAAQGTAMQDQLLKLLGGTSTDADSDGSSDPFGNDPNSPVGAASSASSMLGANSPANPGSDALSVLLQSFLKNSMPAGSLLNAIA